jgi:hypothetical protein
MVRAGAWLLGAMLALLMAGAASAQDWKVYRSDAGRFQADMPGTPSLRTIPVPVDGEKGTAYFTSAYWNGSTYAVMYADYRIDQFDGQSPEELLKTSAEGAMEGHRSFSNKAIGVAGHPAREYVFQRADKMFIINRSVLVGTRLYQVIVSTQGTDATRPDIRRFIDSFSLI